MLNFLVDVTPVEPGVWDLIQANYAIVGTAIAGGVATVSGVLVTLKLGLKSIGDVLGKKKSEGDDVKTKAFEKVENLKTLVIRKGQLEVNKKACETEIMNLEIKLDVITKTETVDKIENKIALEKAELAGILLELESVNKEL